jgi:DNA polymerase I-like protein with 3'-5' exonuclease and polymerase domains
MPWIDSGTIGRGKELDEMTALQVYNGLDCAVTFEVWESLTNDLETAEHSDNAKLIYSFERAMQAPSFVMSRRGVLVDKMWRGIVRSELLNELRLHFWRFQKLAEAVWGIPFAGKKPLNIDEETKRAFSLNYNSPNQLKEFFYETLGIEPHYSYTKGNAKISVNREALEVLLNYRFAAPFARYIILMRDLKKKIDVLSKAISLDGRMRCSYNVAGTETGRWSSSQDPFGSGDNLQNWTKKMRRCIVADPGKKLWSIDLSQAESFVTGGLAYRDGRDRSYLDACRSGDLHTGVTKEIWPDLPWTGDRERDKAIAESPFYHALSYRDTSKRLGHGSNYYGKPPGMAKQTKVDKESVATFQLKYFRKFKGIKAYHNMQANRLQMDFFVRTSLGRVRHFFGRPDDDSTLRKAIAFDPQSTVGDLLNLALWRVWNELDAWGPSNGPLELLLQVHDNIVFQLPDDPSSEAIVQRVLSLLEVPLRYSDETVIIPADVETGWNWAPQKVDKKNADGLIAWKGPGTDARKRISVPNTAGLDRVLS